MEEEGMMVSIQDHRRHIAAVTVLPNIRDKGGDQVSGQVFWEARRLGIKWDGTTAAAQPSETRLVGSMILERVVHAVHRHRDSRQQRRVQDLDQLGADKWTMASCTAEDKLQNLTKASKTQKQYRIPIKQSKKSALNPFAIATHVYHSQSKNAVNQSTPSLCNAEPSFGL